MPEVYRAGWGQTCWTVETICSRWDSGPSSRICTNNSKVSSGFGNQPQHDNFDTFCSWACFYGNGNYDWTISLFKRWWAGFCELASLWSSNIDEAIQELLRKKEELADYFKDQKEDIIFDYIPPQKTNQIFTPKKQWVRRMVDDLEKRKLSESLMIN